MGKRKNTLEDNIDDVFGGWAIPREAKETRELYEPGKDKDSPPTPTKDQKKRGIKSDPQKKTLKIRPSETSIQKRTFEKRPTGDLDNAGFVPIDNIPEADFFLYFNALYEVVLPALNPANRLSRLILCVLFWKSHGFHRNFCEVSFRELERLTGAGRNTLRNNLKPLIEGGWVCIVADGYRQATTYGLRIPASNRGSKIEGLKFTYCISSTCTRNLIDARSCPGVG